MNTEERWCNMKQNILVKYNLESRAVELRGQEKSHAQIAKVLSEESKNTITTSSVQRFFASRDQAKVQAVEKSDKLKAQVAEAEINTVQGCLRCIDDLQGICQEAREAGDLRAAILAIDKIYIGLDMLNKILGKYQLASHSINANDVQINLQLIDCSKRGD